MFKKFTSTAKLKLNEAAGELDFKMILKGYTFESTTFGSRGSTGSGGQGLLWQCCNATKDATKEKVTVHFLHKKEVEEKVGKPAAAELLARMKNGLAQQLRILHPNVLHIVEPLREKGQYLMYVTEPVFASLSNVFGDCTNVDSSPNRVRSFSGDMSEMEKVFGLFQVAEALAFLHNQALLLHLNVCPSSIWVTQKGDWKIAGFDFAMSTRPGADNSKVLSNNFSEFTSSDAFDTFINPLLGPDMCFASPEYVGGEFSTLSKASDLFSYGCLVYEVLSFKGENRTQLINNTNNGANVSAYHLRVSSLTNPAVVNALTAHCGEKAAATVFRLVSSARAGSAVETMLQNAPLFTQLPIKCLIYLSKLPEKAAEAKIKFFKDLYNAIEQYNNRIVRLKVLPALLSQFAAEDNLRYYLLPLILRCVPVLEPDQFETLLLPFLTPMFSTTSPQIAALLLQRLVDIASKCTAEQVKTVVVPFVCRQLQGNASVGLLNVIKKLSLDSNGIDSEHVNAQIVPKIAAAMQRHPDSDIRCVSCEILTALVHLTSHANTKDVVLPAAARGVAGETDPKIRDRLVKYFSAGARHWDASLIANAVLPRMLPILPQAGDPQAFVAAHDIAAALLAAVKAKKLAEFDGGRPQQPAPAKPTGENPAPGGAPAREDWQDDMPLRAAPPGANGAFPGGSASSSSVAGASGGPKQPVWGSGGFGDGQGPNAPFPTAGGGSGSIGAPAASFGASGEPKQPVGGSGGFGDGQGPNAPFPTAGGGSGSGLTSVGAPAASFGAFGEPKQPLGGSGFGDAPFATAGAGGSFGAPAASLGGFGGARCAAPKSPGPGPAAFGASGRQGNAAAAASAGKADALADLKDTVELARDKADPTPWLTASKKTVGKGLLPSEVCDPYKRSEAPSLVAAFPAPSGGGDEWASFGSGKQPAGAVSSGGGSASSAPSDWDFFGSAGSPAATTQQTGQQQQQQQRQQQQQPPQQQQATDAWGSWGDATASNNNSTNNNSNSGDLFNSFF
ncbi:putative inactive serine/threonine-protein kinase scy2 [Diplonema papillatum]|nr:putative inactive serine/threonine-protein kinase scy2 [Diplonema papillatum]